MKAARAAGGEEHHLVCQPIRPGQGHAGKNSVNKRKSHFCSPAPALVGPPALALVSPRSAGSGLLMLPPTGLLLPPCGRIRTVLLMRTRCGMMHRHVRHALRQRICAAGGTCPARGGSRVLLSLLVPPTCSCSCCVLMPLTLMLRRSPGSHPAVCGGVRLVRGQLPVLLHVPGGLRLVAATHLSRTRGSRHSSRTRLPAPHVACRGTGQLGLFGRRR